MLLRLRRRFGTWLAPAIALALFAAMFTVSTLWIGPAIRGNGDDAPIEDHEQHHAPLSLGRDASVVLSTRARTLQTGTTSRSARSAALPRRG
jgi:hypothetical protein